MMRNNNNYTTTARTRVFSTSSSSSSRSSSSSSSVLPQTPRRTMEEVWKDLTFPPPPPPPISLQNTNSNPNPNPSHSSLRGVILQDFLAGPLKETPAADSCPDHNREEFSLPLPPTSLSLNSGLDFEYISANSNSAASHGSRQLADRHSAPFVVPTSTFSDVVSGSPQTVGLFSFCSPNKKVVLESSGSGGGGDGSGDRRHKRMMKNRESAARSRARKQAYTNELELEVEHLVAENEKLKKQYEELRLAMAAHPLTKKTLERTLTAPF